MANLNIIRCFRRKGPVNRRRPGSGGRRHPRRIELLEQRALLDASGLTAVSDRYFTLSFAEDTTEIAGIESSLFAELDQRFGRDEWQTTILQAFQTWAATIATDVGLVQETGRHAFGTAGPTTSDNRFGDVRIGARPLADNVMAISVSQESHVAGTWAADVVFNSEADFNTLDDLFSVALHEAGHVYGLEHSVDPASPMHIHGVSAANELTIDDIANIRLSHGRRAPDAFEGPDGNDVRERATDIEPVESVEDVDGSGPAVALGDITQPTDVDFYRVEAIGDYRGPVTFRLRTAGVSLLAPNLTIYDADESVIADFKSSTLPDDELRFTIPQADEDDEYFIRIGSATDDAFSVGGYSLIVTFDDALRIDNASIESFARTRIRHPDSDTVDALLSANTRLLDDDGNTNDLVEDATELEASVEFDRAARYQVVASISTPDDVDVYKFATPDKDGILANVSVRSLTPGNLIPHVALLNEDQLPTNSDTLVNGGGEFLLQSTVDADKQYFVQVTGPNDQLFDTGDYELTITFSTKAAQRHSSSRELWVAQPNKTHEHFTSQYPS